MRNRISLLTLALHRVRRCAGLGGMWRSTSDLRAATAKAAATKGGNTIAVAACLLFALLLSVELLNRALKWHRFQAATFHSSRILPWSRPSPEPR
ncbi:hypothetical protein SHXM_07551 [Streptomyces hygroscopicus]|nr:hypothetical protein SHXM_07551 [Streptomyces hygroscopicus]